METGPLAVEVLLLDLDGVIRHWDLDAFAALAHRHGMSGAQLGALAFSDELLARAMTGADRAEEWAAEIGRRAGRAHGADPAGVARGFAGLPWSIDRAVVDLAGEVRAAGRARVALFSNASTRLEEDLASCGLEAAFDVVFNSSRLGRAKPDPAAFGAVADSLGVVPGNCLFVDDTVANVEGARRAGMAALVFTGVDALRCELGRLGLLP